MKAFSISLNMGISATIYPTERYSLTMEKMPKLVAFDLDGTLAESKQPVTLQMGALLEELLKKIPVAVMSGAGFSQFEHQLLPSLSRFAHLERLYLFPTNAASCHVYRDLHWITVYDNALSPEERQKIYSGFDEALRQTGLIETPERMWGQRLEDRGAQITFSALGQRAPVEEKKKWNDQFDAKRHELRDSLQKLLPDFSVRTGGMTTIDVTRKGISKAYGVRKLMEMTGVPIVQMIYIGDALEPGGNDAVVLETGIPVQAVKGPEETAKAVESILSALPESGVITPDQPRLQSHTSSMSRVGIGIVILFILFALLGGVYAYLQEDIHSGGTAPPTGRDAAQNTIPNEYLRNVSVGSGQLVASPLTITGEARGTWYFEASFPISIKDESGITLAQVPAQAQADWMTTQFVPFKAVLAYPVPETKTGTLILQRDNPSGDTSYDLKIEIPIRFK